jgi:hypothetical protein
MLSPEGEELGELTGSEHGNHLEFTWPTTTILETPGIHQIVVSFQDALGVNVQAEPYRFVVQAIDGWLTLEQARALWADAPLDDVFLALLLDTARSNAKRTRQLSCSALSYRHVTARHSSPRHAPYTSRLSLIRTTR